MNILKNWDFVNVILAKNRDFANVNFVEIEILEMWILWQIIFRKCEFCEQWDFKMWILWKNEILKLWFFGQNQDFCPCMNSGVIGYASPNKWNALNSFPISFMHITWPVINMTFSFSKIMTCESLPSNMKYWNTQKKHCLEF